MWAAFFRFGRQFVKATLRGRASGTIRDLSTGDPGALRFVAQIFLLAAAWLLWSGYYQWPEHKLILFFGACSVALVVYLEHRMRVLDQESHPYELALRPLVYLPWLAKEIVLSNLHVARKVLFDPTGINPRIIRVPTTQKTDLGRVIYANSITITPGTISLDLRDECIMVHALTQDTADGVLSGDMDAKVTKLEGGS